MGSEWNVSVCGLNCATCDFLKAGQGDIEKQQEIIHWIKQDHGKEISPQDTMCLGCRGPSETHWSPDCTLRSCALGKGITHCYDCNEFVCEKLENFANDGHESHKKAVENLKEIRSMGLEAWIKSQSP